MNGQVNHLPQQAGLTLVTKKELTQDKLKQLENYRYQLMARIATRTILNRKS